MFTGQIKNSKLLGVILVTCLLLGSSLGASSSSHTDTSKEVATVFKLGYWVAQFEQAGCGNLEEAEDMVDLAITILVCQDYLNQTKDFLKPTFISSREVVDLLSQIGLFSSEVNKILEGSNDIEDYKKAANFIIAASEKIKKIKKFYLEQIQESPK